MAKTQTVREQDRGMEEQSQRQPWSSGESQGRMTRGAQPGRGRTGDGWRRGGMQGLDEVKIARGLGWFSIGLGLAEIVAPRGLARLIGVRGDHTGLFRALGMREIASGVGILAARRPSGALAGWLLSRVGGDAMDLALLGAALASPRSNRGRAASAMAAVAGVTALDVITSLQLTRRARPGVSGEAVHVTEVVTINRSAEELYRFWHEFQNLPRFMKQLESVEARGDGRLRWVAKGPAGMSVEWDAEIIQDRPNELIAWRSLPGADVDNAGSVRFERAPGGRGTVVKVEMEYRPPAGAVGATVAKLLGKDPGWQIKHALQRFKQLMETGEIITTEGQPAGRASSISWRYDRAVRI